MSAEAELLPDHAVLVHVGPYKTGTTAIQSSLHTHREVLAEQGVTYPGTYHRQMRPSWALLGRSRVGEDDVPADEWDEMVEEVRAAPGRVVISSEDFASARPEHAAKLVEDLGAERVHVLIVARRLDKLLAVGLAGAGQVGQRDADVRRVAARRARCGPGQRRRPHLLAQPRARGSGRAVARRVPAEQVLVLVNDETDRGVQPRAFERLLGLVDGQLTPGPFTNTSFSMERIELCRQLNLAVVRRDWIGNQFLNRPRREMLAGIRGVPIEDYETPIPPLPGWTAPRLAELSEERATSVRDSGVIVLGDPDLLRYAGDEQAPDLPEPPTTMPVAAAAGALERTLAGALRQLRAQAKELRQARDAQRAAEREVARGPVVADVSSRDLLREVTRRQVGKVRRSR